MKTRLKEARKAAGMTQQEAAVCFDVSLGTYRNWEQGRVVMNGEQIKSAAELFGTDADYILMTDTSPEQFEEELVGLYRGLSDAGRAALLAIARDLGDIFPRIEEDMADEANAETLAVDEILGR